MPYTMNGIGTWYYGKSNLFSYTDFCPYCNRYVTLSSYDTREWFVVLFIPIIPLKRKRIIDACPVCTKHRQMPLKKYLKVKEDAYATARQKCQDNPGDAEAAGQLLGVLAAYQDIDLLDEMVGPLLERFLNDSKLLNTVGMINYQYGRMEQARDCLERSLSIHEDEQIRHTLGFVYARLSDPDTAAKYFQCVLDKADRQKAGSLFALVDVYQAQGRHQEALAWLGHIVRLNPDLEKNKEYKKSLKLSEKYQQSGKPVKNKQIILAQGEKTPLSGKKVWAIAGLVCLVLFLIYAGISLAMSRRAKVYLVNGLNRPYDVVLDGRTWALPQSGWQKIALPEGTVTLNVTDAALQIEPAKLHLSSSFWARPFSNRVYVINPDTMALIEWNKVFYHEDVSKAPDPLWQLYYGKQLYVFDGVQFPFKPLPDQISVSSYGAEARVQIQLFDASGILPEQMPGVIEQVFGFEAKIGYMQKALYYEPDNLMNLYNLYSQADAETFIETIRPGLDALPARVEWHRLYQQAMDITQPEYDLASEYKTRIEKTPDDASMQYLYGRTLRDDRIQARSWFERSIQSPRPSAYGYYALGYDAMVIADFPAALGHFSKALQMDPDNPNFSGYYYDMLVAVNQLDKAEAYCRKLVSQKPTDFGWMQEYLMVFNLQNKHAEAQQAFEQWCARNKEVYSDEDFQLLRQVDRINTAYMTGDFAALKNVIGEPNDVADKVLLTLTAGKPISNALIAQADSFSPMQLLLFYISESRLGNDKNAVLFLVEAAKRFRKGSYEQRYIARCLDAEEPLNSETILMLPMEPDLKAVILTALGIRFPEHRDRFFELAGRLNFKKEFPYYFLNSVHKESPKPAPSAAPAPVKPG